LTSVCMYVQEDEDENEDEDGFNDLEVPCAMGVRAVWMLLLRESECHYLLDFVTSRDDPET